ncbi:hypothetical protein K3495_g13266 [Podosphaera aphanis]|nr:hypothetical protein K3495_g13266 [Podosphaera aphanis]
MLLGKTSGQRPSFFDDSDEDLDLKKPIKSSIGITTPPPSSPPANQLSSERCKKRRLLEPVRCIACNWDSETEEPASERTIDSYPTLAAAHDRLSKVQAKSPDTQPTTKATLKKKPAVESSEGQPNSDKPVRKKKKAPRSSRKVVLEEKEMAVLSDKPVSASTTSISSVVTRIGARAAVIPQKRKRKAATLKFCPENERIFTGKTFYFIPADDVAPLRRSRIAKARSHGALWTKEWVPSITHVVVEKCLNYTDIINYLKPTIKSDTLPSSIILVNDDYPNDCANFRTLLSPHQKKYLVVGSKSEDKSTSSPKEFDRPPKIEVASPKKTQTPALPPTERVSSVKAQNLASQTVIQDLSHSETISMNENKPFDHKFSGGDQPKSSANEKLVEAHSRGMKAKPSKPRDDLDEMVAVASKLQHLPIDDDEESNLLGSQEPELELDSEEEEAKKAQALKLKHEKKKTNPFKQEYTCMKGGTQKLSATTNPNSQTLQILQEMSDYYERIRDEWRTRAYKLAIMTLKKQTTKVTSYAEAVQLPNIGHRLALKIEEIVLTHRLRRLDCALMEPTDHILQQFLKIYGVGLSQASKWVAAGYKTLEDLKLHATLSENQRIGIDHFDDFNTRIPRVEATALAEIVRQAVARLDPNVEVIIGGSYRRGAATCGDIDVAITRPSTETVRELLPLLKDLVAQLTQAKFLVAALAVPGPQGSKWHGACVLPGGTVWRRIDFLVVPASERGAALLYFTGDDIFNRSIRLLSRSKGMRLNQHGLYRDVMRGPGCVKLNEGTLVEAAEEKRIFEVLGVPWRSPEERVCH